MLPTSFVGLDFPKETVSDERLGAGAFRAAAKTELQGKNLSQREKERVLQEFRDRIADAVSQYQLEKDVKVNGRYDTLFDSLEFGDKYCDRVWSATRKPIFEQFPDGHFGFIVEKGQMAVAGPEDEIFLPNIAQELVVVAAISEGLNIYYHGDNTPESVPAFLVALRERHSLRKVTILANDNGNDGRIGSVSTSLYKNLGIRVTGRDIQDAGFMGCNLYINEGVACACFLDEAKSAQDAEDQLEASSEIRL
jgi:hypothetical protein